MFHRHLELQCRRAVAVRLIAILNNRVSTDIIFQLVFQTNFNCDELIHWETIQAQFECFPNSHIGERFLLRIVITADFPQRGNPADDTGFYTTGTVSAPRKIFIAIFIGCTDSLITKGLGIHLEIRANCTITAYGEFSRFTADCHICFFASFKTITHDPNLLTDEYIALFSLCFPSIIGFRVVSVVNVFITEAGIYLDVCDARFHEEVDSGFTTSIINSSNGFIATWRCRCHNVCQTKCCVKATFIINIYTTSQSYTI